MKYLPFDRFTLISPHDPAALAARLGQETEKRSFIPFKRPSTPYYGSVTNEGFNITPAIGYRNSFSPVIVGRFEFHHAGAKIDVVQRLHYFVMAFGAFWATVVATVGFALVNAAPIEGEPLFLRLFPLGMLAFFWVLSTGGFWWEARHTRDNLSAILEAREANDGEPGYY